MCPVPPLEPELQRFLPAYQRACAIGVFARLHLDRTAQNDDLDFLQSLFGWLNESQVGWDQFFHDWAGGGRQRSARRRQPASRAYDRADFANLRAGLDARTRGDAGAFLADPYFERRTPVSLVIEEVEALWAPIAERDDWSLFEAKLRRHRVA